MRQNSLLRHALALTVLVGMLLAWTRAEFYGHDILAEIAIYAILAISLDIVAGYGGMVSLGHGALFGLGAYLYGLFSMQWNLPPLLAVLPASLAAGAVALAVGALVSRLHGIFFIMVTLAIGEMGHEYFFQSPVFGGDDGLSGLPRPHLSALGADLVDPATFALVLIVVLAAVYIVCSHVLSSPYGVALVGLHENEPRMRAMGLPTHTYRATAMGFSGIIAGFAGTLGAMHTQFISPSLLSWQTSGEVLIMVILGGLGTLVGPVIGAMVVIAFKRYDVAALLAELSPCDVCSGQGGDYWHFWLGLLLVLVVITRCNGVVGALRQLLRFLMRGRVSTRQRSGDDGAGC